MRKSIHVLILLLLLSHIFKNSTIGLADDTQFQLAFVGLRDSDICITDINERNVQCLTQTENVSEDNPVWSPDGRSIAYRVIEEPKGLGKSATYIYHYDTNTTVKLPQAWHIFDWSSDGEFLLSIKFDGQDS